eukprot:CAMPEP_0185282776 /NCGR_PEP_ID=MMETSP1359-20130426/67460_1 /TAXON_ID=552665 /ORGANISM="Bigelowiella longifila, Strain CCMP242" /LENGTH=92 /DNA_ID=CAMNT_0027878357 /DNA_START=632 /DNA_END=909 /DNA_ORIENTATION=-
MSSLPPKSALPERLDLGKLKTLLEERAKCPLDLRAFDVVHKGYAPRHIIDPVPPVEDGDDVVHFEAAPRPSLLGGCFRMLPGSDFIPFALAE